DDRGVKQLTALLGVGRWTADWFLARFLGRGDAIAAGDLAVRKSIERFYFKGEKVSEEQIRAFAARWGDYTNLAVHYLLTSHVAG
ncbi:MAG: DNA-3-methyladenine glycosylase 2 family protein, partial [Candidatus Latescibacteria bacterium]|nr:DNA-3-methyladenine glycosylase 2 family protein [Candidatus Latescibacterota bacterium]